MGTYTQIESPKRFLAHYPQNRKHRNRKRYAQQTGQYLNHGSLDLGFNNQIHLQFIHYFVIIEQF